MSTTRIARTRAWALIAALSLLGGMAPLASPAIVAAVVLAPPVLTNPASGDTVTGNPVFAWTAVSGAVKYRIEVSAEADFNPLVSGFPVDTQNLRYAPPAELPLGTLYWRVAALDGGNVVGTYGYDSFIKSWGAAPNVLTPADGAELQFPTDPLLFTWDPLAGAQSYELQVDDADDFIGATSYTTKNTAFVITEPRTVGQLFYWRVRGVSSSIYSDWSPVATFRSVWPTTPELVYPEQNATDVTDLYFDWDPVLGARNYQLQVSPNGDWANNKTIDVTVKSTRYAPPTPLNNGNYFWRVRAVDAASTPNYGPWSDNEGISGDERVFQRGWPDTPSQVWPPDGGSTAAADQGDTTWQNPTFTWTPAKRASWYRVRFSTQKDAITGTLTGPIQGCITNRTTWTPGASGSGPGSCSVTLAAGTTYYWDVAGLDNPVLNPSASDLWGPPTQTSSVIGLRSAVWSFVYEPPSPVVGTVRQLVPEDYLTPARCEPVLCSDFEADTPAFTWTAIPGATGYTVTVALDPNFTNIYRTYTTTFNRLAPRDSWEDNQANQAYYWNVTPDGLALDTGNVSVFQKRSEGIHRTGPTEDTRPNDFTLEWEDYLDTNQALTPAVPQEAKQYRVQVSTVSDFATLIETKTVNTPFYTPYDKTYPEGPIYWRVQAIDGSNNDLTVSKIGDGFLTKASPVPVQSFPGDGDTVTGVPYLQWLPLEYAASYDVQIDNDANFSSPITTTTTKMTAWAHTDALSTGTYYWRVRRNDADNRDGAWSQVWSFVLAPTAPTLIAPTNGANVAASPLLLQWTSSRPTPKYTVELSTAPTFTSQVSGYPQTTVMTSWAPKSLLASGTYYWRVKALNASGSAVATSTTFSFTIGSVVPVTAATYVPVDPVRLLDSRSGNGVTGNFKANTARTFQIAGRAPVPADAVAVTGNFTVTRQTAAGYASLTPVATNNPTTSTLNFPRGDNRANNVTVALGPGGTLAAVYKSSAGQTADFLLDITGYFLADDSGATYDPVDPVRLLDTRVGNGLTGTFAVNEPRTWTITGRGGIPADATAVTGNLTVTGQTGAGYVSVGPVATANPSTSTLNFPVGDNRANGLTVQLAADGTLSAVYKGSAGTETQLILDVTGYYVADLSGARFYPVTPARVLDSRSGIGLSGTFKSGTAKTLAVAGHVGVPGDASAISGNLTVVNQTKAGWVALTAVTTNSPTTSTLNFPAGDTRANGVTGPLSPSGTVGLVYQAAAGATTDLILDITGYFKP